MIRYIEGTVLACEVSSVVLSVHGIGYQVHTAEPSAQYAVGEMASFHTYLAVRETSLDLYGFTTPEHLEVFELLLSLPKVGPKSAQQILAQIELKTLHQAVAEQDPSYLSKISGVGKKSAEKIVFGLKDILPESVYRAKHSSPNESIPDVMRDTIDALGALGYSEDEARNAAREAAEVLPEETDPATLLKRALTLIR